MPKVTYDTNVFIDYNPGYFPAGFYMSVVVIQELAAGARDNSKLKALDAAWRRYEKEDRLLVPNGEDWWLAGKVLSALYRGLKSTAGGAPVTISKSEQQRILRDVLIARTARRANALLVTRNIADFEKIKRFCAVKTVRPEDFLIR